MFLFRLPKDHYYGKEKWPNTELANKYLLFLINVFYSIVIFDLSVVMMIESYRIECIVQCLVFDRKAGLSIHELMDDK